MNWLRRTTICGAGAMVVLAIAPSAGAGGCGNAPRPVKGETVISDEATKSDPVVFRYHQPPAATFTRAAPAPAGTSIVLTRIRVVSGYRLPHLHIQADWPSPSFSDHDLFLYDGTGYVVARSERWNIDPLDAALGGNDLPGDEYIETHSGGGCGTSYVIETSGWHSVGDDMTVRVWLSAPGKQ